MTHVLIVKLRYNLTLFWYFVSFWQCGTIESRNNVVLAHDPLERLSSVILQYYVLFWVRIALSNGFTINTLLSIVIQNSQAKLSIYFIFKQVTDSNIHVAEWKQRMYQQWHLLSKLATLVCTTGNTNSLHQQPHLNHLW